jgi:hypothetical protein
MLKSPGDRRLVRGLPHHEVAIVKVSKCEPERFILIGRLDAYRSTA